MSNIGFIAVGCLSFLVAAALLLGVIIYYLYTNRQRANQIIVDGKVVALNYHDMYYPTIEFTAQDKGVIQFESSFGSEPARHRIGQMLKVRYDPRTPEKAEIESAMTRYLIPTILLFLMLITSCLGIVFVSISFLVP